jgi:hypothetical protein
LNWGQTIFAIRLVLALLALSAALPLHAASPEPLSAACLQNVVHSGDLGVGHQYATQLKLAGLTRNNAMTQLQAIFARSGLRITHTDAARGVIKADFGPTLMEPSRTVDIIVSEEGDVGVVQMAHHYRPGIWVNSNMARTQICGVLGQIQRAGTAVRQPDSSPAVVSMGSAQLAAQVRAVRSNRARIKSQFVGRFFRITGPILQIHPTPGGYAVAFDVGAPDADANRTWDRIALTCTIGPAEAKVAAGLGEKESATLLGRFARFDDYRETPVIELEDCR